MEQCLYSSPLSDEGLPKDAAEKHRIINTVYDKAMALGMAHEGYSG